MHPLEFQFQQARELLRADRAAEAEVVLRRLQKRAPNEPLTQSQLARALAKQGRAVEARFFAERAGASKQPDAVEEAAYALGELGDAPGTIVLLERAVALNPMQASALCSLSIWLESVRRTDEAREMILRAHATAPNDPGITANAAMILADTWSLEEGLELLRSAREKAPNASSLQYALAYFANFSDRLSAEEVSAEHQRHAELLAVRAPAAEPIRCPGVEDAERPLRVGLLSPDLRETAAARFMEAIVREHDPSSVRYVLYPLTSQRDQMSERLRRWSAGWSEAALQSDARAIAAIRTDAIDVLVDLCGLARGFRAGILLGRAAPVQVTYLGYPNTTALRNVDVRLVDSITDPPGAEAFCTERLVRMDPCFLCFSPSMAAADIPPHAPARDGPATFGSFNHLTKITPTVLELWTAIMRRVPDARLIVKAPALASAGVRERFTSAAAASGWADRLELLPPISDLAEHHHAYHRVDIALDTFPYHGTTTTCDALFMGVPVVSLQGDRHAARVGASLLSAAGIPELVAHTREEYVEKAVALAGSATRRSEYHATLRVRMAASPLGDARGFARRFESALRSIWRGAIAGTFGPTPG